MHMYFNMLLGYMNSYTYIHREITRITITFKIRLYLFSVLKYGKNWEKL